MSIFRREEPATPKSVKPQKTVSPPPPRPESGPSQGATRIAPGSKVDGQISGNAELVIEGQVHGEIRLDSRVVVGDKGRVEGTIFARSVEISGKVVGDVQGAERVEVKVSGSLEGDVTAPKIEIASGAFVQGKIDMKGKADNAAKNLGNPKGQGDKESGNSNKGYDSKGHGNKGHGDKGHGDKGHGNKGHGGLSASAGKVPGGGAEGSRKQGSERTNP
jgi:cytoskeletal protein CcmA (bactofilin family)